MKLIKCKVLGILFLSLLTIKVAGQQVPQYSQYMSNSIIVNPAVTGIESYADIRSSFRKQWVGIEESPVSFYTSFHASIGKNDRNAPGRSKFRRYNPSVKSSNRVNKNNRFYRVKPHHGVGAIVQVDKLGLLKTTSINFLYAYHLPVTKAINVSTGVSTGFVRNRFDVSKAKVVHASDQLLVGDSPGILKADVSLGTWIYTSKAFLGISGAHLINSGSDFEMSDNPTTASGKLEPHYYITAGYRIGVGRELTLTPSIMYRKVSPAPASLDLNVKALYGERMWLGLSYRNKDAFTLLGGLNISHLLDFGYSYDITTSGLNQTSAGSHEILLGIKVNNKSKIICPQWIW